MHRELQYLHRNQIDTNKWDRCITNAGNGLIYARSFFLDNMASAFYTILSGYVAGIKEYSSRKGHGGLT